MPIDDKVITEFFNERFMYGNTRSALFSPVKSFDEIRTGGTYLVVDGTLYIVYEKIDRLSIQKPGSSIDAIEFSTGVITTGQYNPTAMQLINKKGPVPIENTTAKKFKITFWDMSMNEVYEYKGT